MQQYNDIEFHDLFYKYHPEDNTLRCENNIVYYNGETKFFAGLCGVKNGECVNLGRFRIGTIDIPVWKLESDALFFLIREYVNSIYMVSNINDNLKIIDGILQKPILTTDEQRTLSSFMDYYNSLKMFRNFLRDNLKENFDVIGNWISDLLKTSSYTPGFQLINNKFFENAKGDQSQSGNGSSNSKALVRVNTTFKPIKSSVPLYDGANSFYDDFISKGAFATLIMIIFIIIATIAIVRTLLFL